MMTNLFSIFDPSLNLFLSKWIFLATGLFFLSSHLFLSLSTNTLFSPYVFNILGGELKSAMKKNHAPLYAMLLGLFFLISIFNTTGLLPYTFVPTSHMVLTVSLAFPMWMAYTGFSFLWKFAHFTSHLVPSGTPLPLAPLMVLIETTSIIIRPFALSIRLAANMIAGHLLMSLLSSYAPSSASSVLMSVLLSGSALSILESAVALIQSYVFMTLTSLYLNEI